MVPHGPASQRSVRPVAVLVVDHVSGRSGDQLAPVAAGAAFHSGSPATGRGRPYVSTSRVTISPPPKTAAAIANSAMSNFSRVW